MTGQAGQHAGTAAAAASVLPAAPVSPAPASPAPASRAVVALAGLLALVLLTAVGVAALRTTSVADADTMLTAGADAVLELPDGTSRPALVGERVPPGSTLRAGTSGAELTTRDRTVHLGQATTVTVVDGARQRLDAGYVMVDATDAPGLEMATTAAVVDAADDSLVRVVAGPVVRVGVLRGDTARVRAAGRQASTEVARYYQAQVAAGGLPTEATPLLLTGDAFEMRLARELYDADRDLNALARRLDTTGEAGPAVLSVLATVVPSAAPVPGAPESERALGFLVAAAADADDAAGAYEDVRGLRTAGGSWGVVAAIVETTPNEVSGVLGALLAPDAAPALAAGSATVSPADLLQGLLDPPSAPDAPAPSSAPTTPGSSPAPTPGPGSPAPSPSPTPSRPSTGVPLVDDVVDTVLDLIDPSPRTVAPAPTPTPSPLLDLDLPLLD